MMKKYLVVLVLGVIAIPLIGAVRTYTSIEPIRSCDPIGNAHPLCGWQNPEDMVMLPGEQHVIVSEYGGMEGEKAGALALLDLATESRRVLYRGGSAQEAGPWGERDCLERPHMAFSPHGIHFSQRADGELQLLAVQHNGRESVEMFEVIESPDGWTLAWRGCVLPPEGSMLNDVVASPEGGFLVTHMMTKRSGIFGQFVEFMKGSLLGSESGYVLAWKPDKGFSQLASSQGAVPNGIEISPDGEQIFVNYSASGEVRRINRHTDTLEASNDTLPPLDNATWAPNGHLLVAGAIAGPLEMMPCMNLEEGNCPGAFAILSLDPDTLESQVVYEGGPETPSGAGTVGLRLDDGTLLIGTFAGDRIVRVMP